MARQSPFSGIKLTEQTRAAGPDQRLFTTPPVHPRPATESGVASASPQASAPAPQAPEKRRKMQAVKPAQPVETPASGRTQFDINITPSEFESLRLTPDEIAILEDSWHELRRALGRKLAKNDVLRCAIYYVVSEYQERKDNSILVRMLKRKKI